MALQIYNTLARKLETFVPLVPGHVGMYVCGPTVYGDAHLGHAKSYVSFDVIARYLRASGYKLRYVQNITDVGHMTDNDEDGGEDKVAKKATVERVEPMEIVTRYTMRYFEDMTSLGVLYPDIVCQASGHIPEQIAMVERLIESGNAYESNGSVYFSVETFPEYGKLSGRKVDELIEGTRVAPNAEKRNPADFAMWKKAGSEHVMQWPSPWGQGYPGWHVECSAMSQKYLGETFDIHGGGLENQFPHHECEIAQSEADTGKPFARYWLHNNMLTIDGVKMGKSLGNYTTVRELLEKFSSSTIRLFILSSHYRSVTDFSDEALGAAQKGMERISTVVRELESRLKDALDSTEKSSGDSEIEDARMVFTEAMDDDFNTPRAVGAIFDLVRALNTALGSGQPLYSAFLIMARTAIKEMAEDILGLNFRGGGERDDELVNNTMKLLLDVRQQLRNQKSWELSDYIRNRLMEVGIEIKDQPDRTTWSHTEDK